MIRVQEKAIRALLSWFLLPVLLVCADLAPAHAAIELDKQYFEDKSAAMKIEDILAQRDSLDWRPVRELKPRFGPTSSVIWLRFRLPGPRENLGLAEPLFLEVDNAYLRKVEFFSVLGGKVLHRSLTGMGVPLSQRGRGVVETTPFLFRIPVPREPSSEYFLSAESIAPLTLPARVIETAKYSRQHWTGMIFLGIFFGGLVMGTALSGFMAITLRSRLFLSYSLFVAGITMAFLVHEGLTVHLLWPESPWWATHEIYFYGTATFFFYVCFIREFLESRRVAPWLDRLILALVGVAVFTAAWSMISVNQPVAVICQACAVLGNLVALAIATKSFLSRVPAARYFFLSSLAFNLSIILFQLQEAGIIWIGAFMHKAPHIGTLMEVVLLSLALGYRIRLVNLELAQQKIALVHSEKLKALGRMAGEIAHEINNPLAIIHGNAVLIGGSKDASDIEEYAATIKETATRISKIVKGLRTLARDSRADPLEETLLAPLLEGVVALCEKSAGGSKVKFEVADFRSDLLILCRNSEIWQVLMNLLNNAIDAVEGIPNPTVRIEVQEKLGAVEVAVTDNGSGVLPDILPRIHEPFFTTKEVGKGLGLGLSISRAIVEAHGGKLFLDEGARQTRFVFSVPASPTTIQ
jgi:signal transduction histidine kinase